MPSSPLWPWERGRGRRRPPDAWRRVAGKTEDSARLSAALVCAPIGGIASHPPDTIKTCLQGDIEMAKFKGYGETTSVVIKERGLKALWSGYPWRCFRQIVALMMFDKIQSDLVPILFPHAFPEKKRNA